MLYKCPKCKGKGKVRDVKETITAGVFTLGVLPLLDYILETRGSLFVDKCNICDGEGFLKTETTEE